MELALIVVIAFVLVFVLFILPLCLCIYYSQKEDVWRPVDHSIGYGDIVIDPNSDTNLLCAAADADVGGASRGTVNQGHMEGGMVENEWYTDRVDGRTGMGYGRTIKNHGTNTHRMTDNAKSNGHVRETIRGMDTTQLDPALSPNRLGLRSPPIRDNYCQTNDIYSDEDDDADALSNPDSCSDTEEDEDGIEEEEEEDSGASSWSVGGDMFSEARIITVEIPDSHVQTPYREGKDRNNWYVYNTRTTPFS